MPVLPFSINKGIRNRFNFPSRSAVKRQNEAPFPNDTTSDVIDIQDKAVSGDEEFVSKGSLDSTSTEKRVYYEPLDVNISPEPLMSSFPPEFLKRKTKEGMAFFNGVDCQAIREQSRESIADGFGGLGFDDDTDVIAKLQGMDASTFVGIPSSSDASQAHIPPAAPSTVDLNHATATLKKAPPAPIQISTTVASYDDEAAQARMSQSQNSTPESSAVSGTTLARQLINNTFVLSIDTRDSRRYYRSGTSTLTRSDSATLPAGDYPPFFSPRDGDVPPVPPMPSEAELVILASKASTPHSLVYRRKTGEFKRRSSTGSLNPSPSSPVAYSEVPVTAVIDTESVKRFRRISRISEATTTSLPGTPARATNDMEAEANGEDVIPSSPENEQVNGSQVEQRKEPPPPLQGTIIQGSLKPLPELPLSATTTSENAEQAASPPGFDLDAYYSAFTPDSLPRGFKPAFSPITEVSEPAGSATPTTVSSPPRRDSQRSSVAAQFILGPLAPDYLGNRNMGPLSNSASGSRNYARLPIRERPMSQLSPSYGRHQSNGSSSSTGSGSELISPPVGDIFRRKRSGSAPSPIVVLPDRELGKYRITISPNDQRDTPPLTSGIGNQTFPETPDIYSAGWSASFTHGTSAKRGEMDANLPLFPQTPMSATTAFGFTGQIAQTARAGRFSRLGPTRSMGARPPPTKETKIRETTESAVAPLTQSQEQNQVAVGEGIDSRPPVQGCEQSGSAEQLSHLSSRDEVTQSLPDRSGDTHHQQESSHTSSTTIESTDRLTASSSSDYLEPSRMNAVTHQPSSSSLNRAPSPTLQPPTPFIHAEHLGDSPPSYDTVFGDRLASSSPPMTPGFSLPPNFRRSPHTSLISLNQDSPSIASLRPRQRPRLPIGPRERRDTREGRDLRSVSGPMRDRNGSVSSVNSTLPSGVPSQTIGTQSPRFQVLSPRFKGVTMEAAKWTFTTDELQAIASRAIREAAEGSSIRLLHLRTLDNDIPEDLRRLEAEGREIQSRYKNCSRRRQKLLDNLSNSLSSPGNESPGAALRVVETLKEVTAQMDKLAEDLHNVDEQIARLNGLVLRHSGGALSMALRKLNKSWHEKVAELDDLKLNFRRVEIERDEAYRQADEACKQVDDVMQKVANQSSDAQRRLSVRRFKAGLHSAASRRSSFNSNRMSTASIPGSSAKSPFAFEDIPPVPSIPRPGGRVREMYINIPPPQTPPHSNPGQSTGPTPQTPDPRTLLEQEELYGDIERRINSLRRSRSFGSVPLTADPRGRTPIMMMMGIPRTITRRNSTASSSPLPVRPSSLPGDPGLSDAKRAMNADTDAMLVTLRLLSDTSTTL